MAAGDFADIRSRVQSRDYGAGDVTRINAFINETYADVQRSSRWSWNRATAALNLSAGQQQVSLPTDLLYFGRIQPTLATSPHVVEVPPDPTNDVDFVNHDPYTSVSTSAPSKYTRYGGVLRFDTIADKAYAWTLHYWQTKALLSADGDIPAFGATETDVLVYGALQRLSEHDRNPTMAQYYGSIFQAALAAMISRDNMRTAGPSRARMPSAYRGRFD